MNILDKWGISPANLTLLLEENPSLRGMLLGYVAELKLKEKVTSIPGISLIVKFDDHDRKRKGDLYIVYKGRAFDLESKSLQSGTVQWDEESNRWHGKAQVDGSDRRTIQLPDGSTLNTTLLLRGEFDILAVNCFAFNEEWKFVFARSRDLPHSSWRGYTEEQQKNLIASLIPVTWPPSPPFYGDLQELLNELILEGAGSDPIDLN